MTAFHLYQFLALLSMASLIWILPKKIQMDGIALSGNIFIAWFSPATAIILLISTAIAYLLAKHRPQYTLYILGGIAFCSIQFIAIRYMQQNENETVKMLSFIGLSYFTCRTIHYLVESYKGRIQADLRLLWHYQSFLPVFTAGPINRYTDFSRSLQRRRWEAEDLSKSIERIIYGYLKITFIGNYLISHKLQTLIDSIEAPHAISLWLQSLIDWAYLYAQFSGWSDVAIGFSLMMGIKINENFNYPLKAKNLVDFWQRWHISLSSWCKDYVFTPILSIARRPFLAICSTMIVMGIWHELSMYYILWGIYHASGIALCRVFQQHPPPALRYISRKKVWPALAWAFTMSYIITGAPVISAINNGLQRYAY